MLGSGGGGGGGGSVGDVDSLDEQTVNGGGGGDKDDAGAGGGGGDGGARGRGILPRRREVPARVKPPGRDGAAESGSFARSAGTNLVRRCWLTVLKPVLKAPMLSALDTIISQTAFNFCFQIHPAPLQPGCDRGEGGGGRGGGGAGGGRETGGGSGCGGRAGEQLEAQTLALAAAAAGRPGT